MIDTTNEATRDIRDVVSTPPNQINRTTNEYVREIRDSLCDGSSQPKATTPLSGTYYGTTSYWNAKTNMISQAGYIYIYSDYQVVTINGETYNVPAMKVGDGTSYLIDLPFISSDSSSSSTTASIISNTTAGWNSNPLYISQPNVIYVYTDHTTLSNGVLVPGLKVGDGMAYVVDLPFIGGSSGDLQQHISNLGIHVADDDRELWDNKWSGYIDSDDSEKLVFTTELV